MPDLTAIRARHVPNDPAPGYTGRVFCLADGQTWPCDTAIVLAALDAARQEYDEHLAVNMRTLDEALARERRLEGHSPWARAVFAEQRLWLACSCGWNAMRDAEGTYDEHLRAALAETPEAGW